MKVSKMVREGCQSEWVRSVAGGVGAARTCVPTRTTMKGMSGWEANPRMD